MQPTLACLRPGPLVQRVENQGLPVVAFKEHRIRELGKVIGGIPDDWTAVGIFEVNRLLTEQSKL